MRRALAIVVSVVVLTLAFAAPVAAADPVARTWSATLGTSGSNGRAVLRAFVPGYATITFDLRNLRANARYTTEVRAGSCGKLGVVLARPGQLQSSATGRISIVRGLSTAQMNTIWPAARRGQIVLRVASGTHIRCATLVWAKATRVRIPHYAIDRPVIQGPSGYPPCGVAMFLKELWQPREPGVTMIYAHARRGLFLPLLNASKVNSGRGMIGKLVYVYTSDSYVHTYRITSVRRHVTSIQSAFGVSDERLWLFTSEGPTYRYPKLIVVATRVSSARTTYAASHPTPRPYAC
jgi:hypothetical protein